MTQFSKELVYENVISVFSMQKFVNLVTLTYYPSTNCPSVKSLSDKESFHHKSQNPHCSTQQALPDNQPVEEGRKRRIQPCYGIIIHQSVYITLIRSIDKPSLDEEHTILHPRANNSLQAQLQCRQWVSASLNLKLSLKMQIKYIFNVLSSSQFKLLSICQCTFQVHSFCSNCFCKQVQFSHLHVFLHAFIMLSFPGALLEQMHQMQ